MSKKENVFIMDLKDSAKKRLTKQSMNSKEKVSVKKSKHQKLIEKRVKKWLPHHDVRLESLIFPTKNGEYLLSLQQFQSDKENGDILIVHGSKLDIFIRHLFDVKKGMQRNKSETNIVIDEWDLNSEQSKHRRELSLLVAMKMKEKLFEAVQKECDGCVHEQPNQAHDLCLAPLDDKIDRCFLQMLYDIDITKINPKFNKEQLVQDHEWLLLTKSNLLACCD